MAPFFVGNLCKSKGSIRIIPKRAYLVILPCIAMRSEPKAIHLEVPQAIIVQDLVRLLIESGNGSDGEPYLVKLRRHLQDAKWAGHYDRCAFIAEWLGTPLALTIRRNWRREFSRQSRQFVYGGPELRFLARKMILTGNLIFTVEI